MRYDGSYASGWTEDGLHPSGNRRTVLCPPSCVDEGGAYCMCCPL